MSSEAKIGVKTLLYLIIVAQFVAVSLSFVILFALSIPLFIQLKNGTFHQSAAQLRRRDQEPPYSTYNLYLVYLALLDLAYLLPTIAAELCTLTPNVCSPRFWSGFVSFTHPPPPNKFYGLPIDWVLALPYAVGNVWINAVIAYEVWLLLKATRRGQRITQPSLTRVNLQCGGVIFGAMVFGVFNYYMYSKSEYHSLSDPYIASLLGVTGLLSNVPNFYAIGLAIFAKCRGYIPSVGGSTTTSRNRAVRGLALYFFRVVIVFVSIWVPAGILGVLSNMPGFPEIQEYLLLVGNLLMSFQPILTFWMILGKDDVKKYIKDFVTLSYLRGSCTCCRKADGTMDATENPDIADEQSRRTKTVTILGYNFEDGGDTDDTMVDQFATGSNDDAEEQEADTENNVFVVEDSSADNVVSTIMVEGEDDNNDSTKDDDFEAGIVDDGVETGNSKYKSRRIRREGPAARVLATGEACPISLQQEDQVEKP